MKHWICSAALVLFGAACAATEDHEHHDDGEDVNLVYEDTSETSTDPAIAEADAHFQRGDWEMAAEAYAEITSADPNNGVAWHHLGYALHAMGNLEEALPAHIKAANSSDRRIAGLGAYNAACAHALLGDKDKALEWLGQSIEVGFRQWDAFRNDPDLDSLRTDPRFDELLNWAHDNPVEEEAELR